MIDLPREPNPGEALDSSWGVRVVRALRALFPTGGPGIHVDTGPTGTTISAAASHVARAKSDGDGAVIGVVQLGAATYGQDDYVFVRIYPNWPDTSGYTTARLFAPCVYRRAPLIHGDAVICHPCAIGVTTAGEDA